MPNKSSVKPGEVAEKNLNLSVKKNGKEVGEINVPAGSRVPPTRIKGASYSNKK